MTPPHRGALEHENWIAYLTGVGGATPSVEIERLGGVVGLRSRMPFDWFNQVMVERDDAAAADLLATARPGPPGAERPMIRLRDGIDDRFVPDLIGAGWVAGGEGTMTPGMVAFPIDHLASIAPDLPAFHIRRISDPGGVDDHRAVVAEGFAVPRSVAVGTADHTLLRVADATIYVGYADGLPVTSGLGWRSGRTIGVYAITTVPAARRRGYAEAMTARVVRDGIAAGCDVAVLQASEAGRPIYERLGFRVDVAYRAYLQPDPAG